MGAGEGQLLNRSLAEDPLIVVDSDGIYMTLASGQKIIDACGGAAVISVGHKNKEVNEAMIEQMDKVMYIHSSHFTAGIAEKLASHVVNYSGGDLVKAYFVNSGSEATEAAQKLARQYFCEIGQPERTEFISRDLSYHGNTLGSLALSGHKVRRKMYEPILSTHYSKVSASTYYRFGREGETEEQFVARLAQELDDKFQELGPEKVIAFVAEPVVGATQGAAVSPPGYFKAMKEVCDKYGALFISDEVMCGSGRTGTFFAYKQEGFVPDIVTLGKALGGGMPIAGVVMGPRIVDALSKGTKSFMNGHTYQAHPVCCAAATKVMEIFERDSVVENVMTQGTLMGKLLHEKLDNEPFAGNVRGRGLIWAVDLVKDKATKEPYPANLKVEQKIADKCLEKGLSILAFPGTIDGVNGSHVILSPPFILTKEETEKIVEIFVESIKEICGSL